MKRLVALLFLPLLLSAGCCSVPEGAYQGGYSLYVRGIKAPEVNPYGQNWDAGQFAAIALDVVDGAAPLLSLDPVAAAGVEFFSKNSELRRTLGQIPAPDLQMVVSVSMSGQFRSEVIKDSHAAGWANPVLQVPGAAHCKRLTFTLYDIDLRDHDLIAHDERRKLVELDQEKTVSLTLNGGTVVVFELVRNSQ